MSFTLQKSIFNTLIDEFALMPNGRALDLGCGKGFDVLSFAEKGFEVDAVDKNNELLEAIKFKKNEIHIFNASIEDFVIQEKKYNLITASFSLQFLSKISAQKVIKSMINGLSAKGVIIFNLIGKKDEWANNDKWSTWEKSEIIDYLKEFDIKIRNFNEIEGQGKTMASGLKYWHVYEIILIKN